MFVFEFKKNKECLLKAIVITGDDITLYTGKPKAMEFVAVTDGLEHGLMADHPQHHFLHHPTIKFSAAGDSVPHQHHMFKQGVNRLEQLKNFFELLRQRQNSRMLREEDCINTIKLAEQCRKRARDSELPQDIQESLDNFDTMTPLISQEEAEHCLQQFQAYSENQHAMKIETIRKFAEQLLKENWDTLYDNFLKYEYTDEEKSLIDFYGSLTTLRQLFLAIDQKPFYVALYSSSINLIDRLINNPNMPTEGEFFDLINSLRSFSNKRLSTIGKICMGITTFIGCMDLSLWKDMPFKEALLVSIVATPVFVIAHHYISKPISKILGQTLMGAKRPVQRNAEYAELDEIEQRVSQNAFVPS